MSVADHPGADIRLVQCDPGYFSAVIVTPAGYDCHHFLVNQLFERQHGLPSIGLAALRSINAFESDFLRCWVSMGRILGSYPKRVAIGDMHNHALPLHLLPG